MPRWAKILLVVAGIGLVLLVAVGYMGYRSLAGTYEKLERITERAGAEGKAIGSSGTLEDCVQHLVRRSAKSDNPLSLMATTPFAWGCLEAAPYERSFCEHVPYVKDDRAMRSWANGRCARYGAPESESCVFVLTPVASFCTSKES